MRKHLGDWACRWIFWQCRWIFWQCILSHKLFGVTGFKFEAQERD